MGKLNGKKILLLGNHDAVLSKRGLRKFKTVDKLLSIDDHVFGHIHNNQNDIAFKIRKQLPNSFNCGVNVVGFVPKTLDELIELKKQGEI